MLHSRDRFGKSFAEVMMEISYEFGFWFLWGLLMVLSMICMYEYFLWRKYRIEHVVDRSRGLEVV